MVGVCKYGVGYDRLGVRWVCVWGGVWGCVCGGVCVLILNGGYLKDIFE